MRKELKIKSVDALEILDSRGNPTVEAVIKLENGIQGKAKVPSGASTGSFEAMELRDGDKTRYGGKGVTKAVENIQKKISKKIINENVYEQKKIDDIMIELDNTCNFRSFISSC